MQYSIKDFDTRDDYWNFKHAMEVARRELQNMLIHAGFCNHDLKDEVKEIQTKLGNIQIN